jgi:hypothetical protein
MYNKSQYSNTNKTMQYTTNDTDFYSTDDVLIHQLHDTYDDSSCYSENESKMSDVVSKNSDDNYGKQKKKNKYLKENVDKERKPGMYTIKRVSTREVINKDRSISKQKYTKKIHIFETSTQPSKIIVNGATGYPFQDERLNPYRVGSKEEFLLFKVKYAGLESKVPPCTLFFDNPEQYERHMSCTLDVEIKKKWNERYLEMSQRIAQRRMRTE